MGRVARERGSVKVNEVLAKTLTGAGTAVSSAPPVGSNASTAIYGAGCVPPLPIIPIQSSAL